ncbi:hypothetical protein WCP94_000723 (plasmid) [Bilophila wadsworthia]
MAIREHFSTAGTGTPQAKFLRCNGFLRFFGSFFANFLSKNTFLNIIGIPECRTLTI